MVDDSKPHAEIARRLRAFRSILGLQQKEFAVSCGFAPTQYTNWETGDRRIPVDKAAVLEKTYGLTLDFIYLGRLGTLQQSLATSLSEKLAHKQTNNDK